MYHLTDRKNDVVGTEALPGAEEFTGTVLCYYLIYRLETPVLLEFQGENTGSIIMFDDVAIKLLKMMGQSGSTEGAIREPDVPDALSDLKQALANMPASNDDRENTPADDDNEPVVSLHTRASPLIDMLEQCVSKGGYLMWKPQ